MTAVAPPSLQPIPRPSWHSNNSKQASLNTMSSEDLSRMLMPPRKGMQRTNSSSSVASSSSSSSTSTITQHHSPHNAMDLSLAGDLGGWGGRKKPTRSLWPSSKAEPVSGISTARPHSVTAQAPSASGLHQSSSVLPSQHVAQNQQQNGARGHAGQGQGEGNAVLCLLPMNGTFDRKTISVPFFPEVLRIGRQTNAKTVPTPLNGYFDSKVLSRQHAEIWADRVGKIWIRDVKSSNGTFVNGQRLSAENRDSDPHELREQDILELGIDIVSEDQNTVVHHKVAARVEHAGFHESDARLLELKFGDMDPMSGGALMASPQAMRSRVGSQGSTGGNGRFSTPSNHVGNNMNATGQQRHMNFWLTPVTIEQIVKKLSSELKAAKQQSADLQRTREFFDTVLSQESMGGVRPPTSEKPRTYQVSAAPLQSDHKPRFSDPPAPPPKQPLPEKPDVARGSLSELIPQPCLNRTDTERPRPVVGSSPTKPEAPHHVVSLVEALAAARREIDSQGARVKHLEEMLQKERRAREGAEGRAQRLELQKRDEQAVIPTTSEEKSATKEGVSLEASLGRSEQQGATSGTKSSEAEASTEAQDALPARLQQRIELMVLEMNEMRQQMDSYKRRAEAAEQESASSRKSLAEMVEKIRREDAKREAQRKESEERRRSGSRSGAKGEQHTVSHPADMSTGSDRVVVRNGKAGLGGEPDGVQGPTSMALTRMRTPHDQLVHSAPYASILGVVALGFGLMAYLNGWQKVER